MLTHYASDAKQKIQQIETETTKGWLRFEKPSDNEQAYLIELGIGEDILHDALDPHEVPRLEIERSWVYFITRVPDVGDEFNDFTTPLLFAFDGDTFVTVSRDALGRLWQPFIEKTTISTDRQRQLFLLMIDAISLSYQNRVAHINRQMRAVTNSITSLRSKEISVIVDHERKLNDYLDALIPTNTSLEKLLSHRGIKFREGDLDDIEDISLDLEQVIARCKSLLRTIQNVRDSYRAVMDTRLNETMQLLTITTVILTIPTMLAGLFGMNVKLPFEPDSGVVFWAIVGFSLLSGMSVAYYFMKRR